MTKLEAFTKCAEAIEQLDDAEKVQVINALVELNGLDGCVMQAGDNEDED